MENVFDGPGFANVITGNRTVMSGLESSDELGKNLKFESKSE